MIGCDIVEIKRFKKNLNGFVRKILSDAEQIEYDKSPNKIQYIAGRWAAKEAIFKASKIKNAIVLNNSDGSPYVFDDSKIKISISHEKNYAIAVAILT